MSCVCMYTRMCVWIRFTVFQVEYGDSDEPQERKKGMNEYFYHHYYYYYWCMLGFICVCVGWNGFRTSFQNLLFAIVFFLSVFCPFSLSLPNHHTLFFLYAYIYIQMKIIVHWRIVLYIDYYIDILVSLSLMPI